MKKPRRDRCVYCGMNRSLTADHVPPAGIFSHPRPSNLKTVQACRECNANAAKDDEYFRDTLAMREDLSNDPAVKGIIADYYRSLARPRVAKYKVQMLDDIRPMNVISPGGIFVRKAVGCGIDGEWLSRVVTRIVRGLFYAHEGRRLPVDCQILTYERSAIPNREIGNALDTVGQALAEHGIGEDVGDTFRYRYLLRPDQGADASWWLLAFYQRVVWLVCTGKRPAACHMR